MIRALVATALLAASAVAPAAAQTFTTADPVLERIWRLIIWADVIRKFITQRRCIQTGSLQIRRANFVRADGKIRPTVIGVDGIDRGSRRIGFVFTIDDGRQQFAFASIH